MDISPMGDRILLKPVEADKITASGIVLPDSVKNEKTNIFEVVSVGPGNKKSPSIDLQPGDKILKGQYSGDEIKIDGIVYHIVAFEYILAKIS